MKTLILGLVLGLMSMQLMVLRPVMAADTKTIVCDSVNQVDSSCGDDKILGPNGILTKIVQTLVFIIGAVSVIVIIIGGLRYVVSGGDPQGTKGAKDMILYAIVGVIVAILAQGIVTFVISRI